MMSSPCSVRLVSFQAPTMASIALDGLSRLTPFDVTEVGARKVEAAPEPTMERSTVLVIVSSSGKVAAPRQMVMGEEAEEAGPKALMAR